MSSGRTRLAAATILLILGVACAGGSDGGAGLTATSGGADSADEQLGRSSLKAAAGGSGGGGARSADGDMAAGSIGYTGAEVLNDSEAPAAQPQVAQAERPNGTVGPASKLPIGPSVIKTATVEVSIERDRFTEAVRAATTIAERYGGFVVSTAIDDRDRGFASATLRIPADKFGTAMHGVRGLGEVKHEEITGEDVSEQLIDLEARIRNLRSQEVVLLRLMRGANSVLETIRIQDHLSSVQLEIERMRGRLRYLDDQVAYSTIFVEMRQAGAAPPPKTSVLGRAWDRAIEGSLSVVGGVIVAAGFLIPIGLMIGLAALVLRALWPWVTRRMPNAT